MITIKDNINTKINDKEYIFALKAGYNTLVRVFFYEELNGLLNHIQFDLFHGRIEYDELVSELYLYLSHNQWEKLESFEGKNNCRLRTWMSPVAWRFFIREYERLVEQETVDDEKELGIEAEDDLNVEFSLDIESVLSQMSNRRYAEAIELLVIKGYTTTDVAEMWQTNVSNVYNIKHRAILQFLENYKK